MGKSTKWANPQDWLVNQAEEWGEDSLYRTLVALAHYIDSEDIQCEFQEDMEQTDYFKEE